MEKLKIANLEPIKTTMLEMGISKEKFVKEAGFVAAIWNDPKNSYLRKATKESLFTSVISIAQTGLTLNPVAKQAYLIPRNSKNEQGKFEIRAYLEPSYIGLMKLLTDAGQVKNIQTNLVYQGDEFDVNLGMQTEVKHKPYYINNKPKGEIIGVYAVANLADGNKQFEYMTRSEIEEIRSTSESYKAWAKNNKIPCIWIQYEGEMFRKTCIKRIAKHLPRSEQFNYADELVNQDFEMSLDQFNMIESLMHNCTLIEPIKEQIESELSAMTYQGAEKVIAYLKDNQKNPIESGLNYNLSDINKQMDSKIDDPNS